MAERYRVGQRFNHWTLLERLPQVDFRRRWRCRCDCGAVKVVAPSNLINGTSKSCGSCGAKRRERENPGVSAIKPLLVKVGDVYHDWTVLEILPVVKRNRLVRCRCACGAQQTVYASSLRSGRSKRCKPCAVVKRREERRKSDEAAVQAAPPLV